jgi:addiction module HigA family antidote
MDEYQLNPSSLAAALKLSQSGARQVVVGKTAITVPTSIKLAKLFGNEPAFWLDLQREADLAAAKEDEDLQASLKEIQKIKKPAPKKAEPAAAKEASSKPARGKKAAVPAEPVEKPAKPAAPRRPRKPVEVPPAAAEEV